MAESIWIQGENGAIMQFALPLHPGIQDRLDKGVLMEVTGPSGLPSEPEPDDSAAPLDVLPLPKRQEPRSIWEKYAEAQGMETEKIRAMTKAELVEHLRRGGAQEFQEDTRAE